MSWTNPHIFKKDFAIFFALSRGYLSLRSRFLPIHQDQAARRTDCHRNDIDNRAALPKLARPLDARSASMKFNGLAISRSNLTRISRQFELEFPKIEIKYI
jgi:hypothetical protein